MSLVKNAADEAQVKEADKKMKHGRQREIEDVRYVLSTPQGRRFVWRYLSECGLFTLSAHQSGSWTYFNEGQRNVGLKLLADVNEASPEAYLNMLKESKGD